MNLDGSWTCGATWATCETPENPDFLRKDKMVIFVKIQNFSRSRMTKRTSPLESSRGIVSRNLATTSNFVEFRDIRNFTFF